MVLLQPMLWQDFVPPEIPDEHNMATYPGLDLKALIALDSEAWPHQRDMIPRQAGWRAAQPWMLATQFEEGSVNSEEDAAQQLIGFFEQHRPLLDPLRNASARPQCRFELDYADPTLITLPINEIRAGIVAVFANSLASLHVSDSEAAAQDLVAGSRLVRHLDAAPSLVVAMVQIGLMDSALQITWEGLRNHAWDALQLEQIGSALSDWNLTARVLDSLRQDRAALFASLGGFTRSTPSSGIPARNPNLYSAGGAGRACE